MESRRGSVSEADAVTVVSTEPYVEGRMSMAEGSSTVKFGAELLVGSLTSRELSS